MGDEHGYYRTLFANAPDGMAVVDAETGRHLDVNERYCELHGYTEAELLDRDIGSLTADDWTAERTVLSRLRAALNDGEDTVEWRHEDESARGFPVEMRASDIEPESKELARLLVRIVDSTERSERERDLERKTRAMDEAPVGITISDPDLEDNPLVYANEGFERLTGYSEPEVVGRNCRFLQGEGTDPEPVARLREGIDAEQPVTAELCNYRADGTAFWNRVTVAPIRDGDGEVVNYVGFQEDVTERKEREREVARFERLVDHLPVGVFRTTPGPDGEFLEANPALVSMFGADSKADLLARNVSDLYHESETRGAFSERLQTDGEVVQQEVRLQRLDGEPFWGAITAVTVEDESGVYFEGVVQDISTRKAYERRLEAQRDDLELLNEVVRHDIRNDLQVIVAYAEMLETHVDDDGREYLSSVAASADNAVELTKTARDIAQTMLQTDAECEPVSLTEPLLEQVEESRSAFDGATITVAEPLPDVTVMANDMLASVFRNLLKNAVQHNDRDTPEITVSVTEDDERVVVHVTDNGPGVPDDRKTEIFGKGEKGLDSEGTGIGLYLVNTLVEQYGGSVWVTDAEPRGATFNVALERA